MTYPPMTVQSRAATHCYFRIDSITTNRASGPCQSRTLQPESPDSNLPSTGPGRFTRTALAGIMLVVAFMLAVPTARGDNLGRASFSWEAVADPVVTGYKVHWGSESGVYTHSLDAGNVVEVIIAGFAEGGRYFAAVTAYDNSGEESDYSTELFFIYDTTDRVILLEAEDGALTPPMESFTDESTTWVAASIADPNAATTLSFTTPYSANFYIWCRVFAPTATSDSLDLTVDQEAALVYDVYGEASPPLAAYQADWTWSRIVIAPGIARAFVLGGGPHSIRFGYREDALLDRVVIVSNPDFVPTDALPHSGDFVAVIDQPQDGSVAVGGSVIFSATIVATGPASYQWFHAGVLVPTECRTSLTLADVQPDQGGPYSLTASTDTATVSTRSATLSVLPPVITVAFRVRAMTLAAEGQVTFDFEGALGTEIGVYASSDLVTWSLIATSANTGDTVTINDPEAIEATARFYRLGDIGRP